ncbi:hypothetical protein MMC11_001868 [Xylographa trunciseda]|nr:hypothetical protein [Xylographa trunciseda]
MENATVGFGAYGQNHPGFPRRLPDDCVEYSMYVLDQTSKDAEIRERLRNVQSATNNLTRELLKDFIWQRDGFVLELVREDGNVGLMVCWQGMSCLRGRTNYGDSVQDEWLVVYILRELSKQFQDIWVKVVDTDGEFLLIEAAGSIPRWLNPEIADNRVRPLAATLVFIKRVSQVWINNGQLLIIPIVGAIEQPGGSSDNHRALTLWEACTCIKEARSQILYSPIIEAEAFYRLRNYPQQVNGSLHHAVVRVPRNLAYILHQSAAYISPAVEAFYLRDPIALRPLQAQSQNDLVFPPKDLVTMAVKFTKVGFAQVKSQRFSTPAAWVPVFSARNSEQSRAQTEMGMKITCGFEMLVSDPQNQDHKVVREIRLLLGDLDEGEDQLPSNAEISQWGMVEDDEAWLDVNFDDFENELSGTRQEQGLSGPGFGDKFAQEDLQKMVARFKDFLDDDAAGSEGAEYLDDMDNDDDEDEGHVSEGLTSEEEDGVVSFDEDKFTAMMKEMMGMPAGTGDGQSNIGGGTRPSIASDVRACDIDSSTREEELKILHLSQAMEAELKAAGALQLDSVAHGSGLNGIKNNLMGGTETAVEVEEAGDEDDSDGDLHIDFNLAKNLLESFKSQIGTAGPGSSIMGMRLPRDEDSETPHN